jgi:pimeloyl-ACP methyl ester carboxylesterase
MPLWHQQELASHYASSEVITVLGAGHEAMWERQPEFLARIRAYFAEIGFAPMAGIGGAR